MKLKLSISTPARVAIRAVAVLAVTTAVASPGSVGRSARMLAPAAPVLESFDGKSHADSYILKGEIDSVRVASWVRIVRDGVQIDSVSGASSTAFSIRVPLHAGVNNFQAVLRDSSFNVSALSNRVTVNFDDDAGLFIPVPMIPGRSLDLNAVDTAVKAELRIFDVTGDLVVRFESHEQRTFYSFVWDGMNASDQPVQRGPLVAVGVLSYPDGTHNVVRRAFLFDPAGAP